LRNGALNSAATQTVCRKDAAIQQEQQTPWHFHSHKMEDILNRAAAICVCSSAGRRMRRYLTSGVRWSVRVDGRQRTFKPGETLVLKPGVAAASVSPFLGRESVCARLGDFDGE
jgi:D-lyxose ketol-isomerase